MADEQTTIKKAEGRTAADHGRSRLGDSTRPISVDRRLTTRRRYSVLLWVAAIGIAGALAASLFVIPVQTYLAQNDQLTERAGQLAQLQQVNAELRAEVERLQTPDGIEEAAREQLGYQQVGEERETITNEGVVPLQLPVGWPYNLVANIAAVRRNGAPPTTPTTISP